MVFDFLKNKKDKKGYKTEANPMAKESTEVRSASIAAPISPVLRSFHISEKSARGIANNQYTFVVGPKTTKTQVRDAVKRSYKVDVIKVNVVNLPKKKRRIGGREGAVPAIRKAIVILKEGQSIVAAQP